MMPQRSGVKDDMVTSGVGMLRQQCRFIPRKEYNDVYARCTVAGINLRDDHRLSL
jgi:hypothetical protein